MKKTAAFLIMLFSLSVFSKTLVIEANYRTDNGKLLKKQWQVKIEGNTAKFFLDGKLKANMYLKNGKIIKIEEYKFFAGKERVFAITKPQHINLELNSRFFPFNSVLENITKKTNTKDNRVFKIVEVKEK